jgi:S-adenosylmethionine-diacylglycerol 3-amino-3-carboxypropyl transferase
MSDVTNARPADTRGLVLDAMGREGGVSGRIKDALFARLFSGLVYAQIWEDPVIDAEGLRLGAGDRIAAIASGGCNVMSYCAHEPARILAVDLNAHHIALLNLKIAAAKALPDHAAFRALFADADSAGNVARYDRHVAGALDAETRRYWDGRGAGGRRRIAMFERGFHRHGALGRFIGVGHLIARLHGVRLDRLLQEEHRNVRRAMFWRDVAPIFDSPVVRFLASSQASLFGLGIPPAQYEALADGRPMADVLRERLERLICDFEPRRNYFAWQALARRYDRAPDAALPPYLEARHFGLVRAHADRIEPRRISLTTALAAEGAASFDKYVLLDAQDWMSPRDMTALWSQIDRTARPGARVLFRTAAAPSVLPGHVDDAILARWIYDEPLSRSLTRRDRSAIYGGVHVYARKETA